MTASVESLTHRILCPLKNFRSFANDGGAHLLAPSRPPLQANEHALGVYENEPRGQTDSFVVTNLGLHVHTPGGFVFVRYDQIGNIVVPGEKIAANRLEIVRSDGSVVTVRVTGGLGRFRDVWEVMRFLDRVTADDKVGAVESKREVQHRW